MAAEWTVTVPVLSAHCFPGIKREILSLVCCVAREVVVGWAACSCGGQGTTWRSCFSLGGFQGSGSGAEPAQQQALVGTEPSPWPLMDFVFLIWSSYAHGPLNILIHPNKRPSYSQELVCASWESHKAGGAHLSSWVQSPLPASKLSQTLFKMPSRGGRSCSTAWRSVRQAQTGPQTLLPSLRPVGSSSLWSFRRGLQLLGL